MTKMTVEKEEKIEKAIGDFQPIPFYFLNDDVDRAEIVRQLDFMREKGIQAYFLHLRDGICNQAFATRYFFENIRYIVEESAKRGLKVWLYDEDAYPSGNCGGLTVLNKPELQAKTLCVQKVFPDRDGVARLYLGENIGVCGYLVKRENGVERVERVDDCFGSVRRRWYKRELDKSYMADMADLHFKHMRGATCYAETMFEMELKEGYEGYCVYQKPVYTDNRYGTQANLLDRRTAEYFIERVHNRYEQYVGEYFGSVIPGIFLDEPVAGGNAYCEDFDEAFEREYGYSPKKEYYKLCPDYEGDSAAFRRQYNQMISLLFQRNFLAPIREWCDRTGLLLCGHFTGEENICTQACGNDLFAALQYLDIPGIDLIGNDVGDLAHCVSILGGKVASSAAWQAGKDILLCEAFALNPYNFGYQGMKLNADWLFACGVNVIVPHGFHYGYSAFQRADAGKSFFFQDPLFDEYLRFSAYAARVGRLLHEYRAENTTLVVLPVSACAEETLKYPKNSAPVVSNRTRGMLDVVYDLIKQLCAYHVDWDVAYPQTVLESKIENGALVIGERQYKKVIVVKGGEIEKQTFKMVEGKVEWTKYCLISSALSLGERLLEPIEGDARKVFVLKKTSAEGELYFLFNNGREYVRFTVNKKEKLCAYDAESDSYFSLEKNKEIALNGYQSLILLTKEIKGAQKYELPERKEVCLGYKDAPDRIYKPIGCKYAVTRFDLVVGKEEKRYEEVGCSRLRDVLGTVDEIYRNKYMVPYFDVAPRIPSPYPVCARYEAKLTERGGGILFDGGTISGAYALYFNGERVKKLHPKRVYDKSNLIFYPKWKEGENLLEIRFEKGEEFDGINGEFFVMEEGI